MAISIGLSGAALAQGPANIPAEAKVAGTGAIAHPEIWPAYKYPVAKDAKAEAMIAALLKRMTIEEKIGQLVQGDISAITPADMKKYHLGSVLAGGSSGPNGDDKAPAAKWLALADQFYDASVDKSNGGVGSPRLWGIDRPWRGARPGPDRAHRRRHRQGNPGHRAGMDLCADGHRAAGLPLGPRL